VLFGVAYLLVRLLNLVLYAIAGRRDPDLLRALIGFAPAATIGPVCILLAGFVDGGAQTALWGVGLAVLYGGALIGRGRGWHISPSHFAERYGLIVIIALGESIIALGVGAAGFSLSAGIISAAVLGVVVVASLWWAYFDVVAVMSQRQLAQTTGAARARLARDYYSYLHEPMIAGIVLFALGLKTTIEHVGEPLAAVPAVALCGGLALYFLTHVGLRVRLVRFIRRTTAERPGWIGPGRLATGLAMLALIPAALELPALASLALVTAVCCGLIAWDVIHYREHRAEVRRARPSRSLPRPEVGGPSTLESAEPIHSAVGRGSRTTTAVSRGRRAAKPSRFLSISAQRRHSRSRSSPVAALPSTSRRIPPASSTTAWGWAWRFSHHAGSAAPQPFIAIETRLGPSS
jgi:low temperature requirement protein LtrA